MNHEVICVHIIENTFICIGEADSCSRITFGAGIYTGIYISQNYEVPRVDEPGKLVDKIKEFADEHRKK
ncbi:uncharacterized protein LOC101459561 [Ceratitis capitata]|uniref:uncharacterized protein LOC101459561 n=1 Tax=Ceratitis capitata TaxID=7213 RepID=UPI000A116BD9|nr:uncharacterized protein LOC101459561 [Ceratitis capitata]